MGKRLQNCKFGWKPLRDKLLVLTPQFQRDFREPRTRKRTTYSSYRHTYRVENIAFRSAKRPGGYCSRSSRKRNQRNRSSRRCISTNQYRHSTRASKTCGYCRSLITLGNLRRVAVALCGSGVHARARLPNQDASQLGLSAFVSYYLRTYCRTDQQQDEADVQRFHAPFFGTDCTTVVAHGVVALVCHEYSSCFS